MRFGFGKTVKRRTSTARGERINIPCAPSPPRHFCHEYVTTSSLSHGIFIANTCCKRAEGSEETAWEVEA